MDIKRFIREKKNLFKGGMLASVPVPSSLGIGGFLGGGNLGGNAVNTGGFGSIDSIILNILLLVIILVGLISLAMVLYGGFLYITSRGEQSNIEKSRKVITSAIIGIIIVALSFFLAKFVMNLFGVPTCNSFAHIFSCPQ